MRVLLLPGPTQNAHAVRQALLASHPDSVVETSTRDAAADWLAANRECDAVVLDGLDPDETHLVAALRDQAPGLPVVILVSPDDPRAESRALLAGADEAIRRDEARLAHLGATLMRMARRDAHQRHWRVWHAGSDRELHRQLAARLGDDLVLAALSPDGRLSPPPQHPTTPTALILDARTDPEILLPGLRQLRDAHAGIAILVVAAPQHHTAFLRAGADDCVAGDVGVDRMLLGVDRIVSAQRVAAEVVALRVREHRLRALVEYLPEGVVLIAADRAVLAVNLAGLALLGAEEARHVIGRDVSEWLDPDPGEDLGALVAAVSTGESRTLQAVTRHAPPRRVELRAVPFQRDSGKPSAALVVLRETSAPAEPPAVLSSDDERGAGTAHVVATLEQALAEEQARADATERDLIAMRDALAGAEAHLAAALDRAEILDAERASADLRADDLLSRLAHLELESAERLQALTQERDMLRADAAQLQSLRAELPVLREAQRRITALEGQVADALPNRMQPRALELEISELRKSREQMSQLEAELERVRGELDAVQQVPATIEAAVDAETRWLLYEVASIGHLTTTPEARILGANDVAAQLLGHFSRDALQASGRLPEPLLLAAGAFSHRPTRFEVCLQHGEEGPLHWLVGLATPHAGIPATVTWMLIDVSEQRMQARRSRFLRRMEAITHVLSAATVECSTLVNRAGAVIDATAGLRPQVTADLEETRTALARTEAVLAQLSRFAIRRARKPTARDVRAMLDAAASVLVRLAGEDIACAIQTGDEPLHATLDPGEFEQFLTALVLAGRDALPLGGSLTFETSALSTGSHADNGSFMQPAVELSLRARGFGAQLPASTASLAELAARLGGHLSTSDTDDDGQTLLRIRLPRVFLMQ
jgi:PAS domain-containing protein